VTFNFFSLDYIYYPVSGIMWVWHKIFGSFMGANNPWAWVLSVVFLVFTLRGILFKLFMKQMDSQLKMQAVQPEMKKLREKYKDDRQRLTEEMMRLNKEAGVNPLSGCLPAVLQSIVFIGLFHVLRSFTSSYQGGYGNYFFSAEDVRSFVDAKLFGGAPLSAFMAMPQAQLDALGGIRSTVIAVGVPLTILAGIATHLTSRRSVARQATMGVAQTSQTAIMNRLMMYGFPLFVVVGGPFFPLAILFYWLSNNSWTFGQLWVAHRIQDRKKAVEAKVVEAAKVETTFSKPTPGAKPQDPRRKVVQPSPVNRGESSTDSATSGASAGTGTSSNGSTKPSGSRPGGGPTGGGSGGSPGGSASGGPTAGSGGPKPSPGSPRKKKQGKR
jgi:YidC/Oxa1 family membrane protein insertase